MSIDLAKTMQHVAIAGHAGPRELPPSVIEHGYDGLWEGQVKPALDAGCFTFLWYGPFGKGDYGWEFNSAERAKVAGLGRLVAEFEQLVRKANAYGKALGHAEVEHYLYGGNPVTSPTFAMLLVAGEYREYERQFWAAMALPLKLRMNVVMDNALPVAGWPVARDCVSELRARLTPLNRHIVVENGPNCWVAPFFADYMGFTSNQNEADKARPCPPGKRCIMYDQAESWQRGDIVDATEEILGLGYIPAVAVHKLIEEMRRRGLR